ncbi:M67 family peptidase [Erythrobacteraceae bacterium CFH 75059]|uniref:Mov34/MPN/PAD-1 family protein n=1 Tax=Qipengyuania thermophila TaxID=2509361 RepID=UPI0010207CD7|nr:M67 family metallopeptidase [Qipengyuania thermophila]TCD02034.1 M67 family peptidase [Erythrobacteraceae bacterium CFH 75059]
MAIVIARKVCAAVTAMAARQAPEECCGLLLGRAGTVTRAIPAANVHPHPHAFFFIAPEVLLAVQRSARARGLEVLGCYHSHPQGPPEPSAADRAMAAADGAVWAIAGRSAEGGWTLRAWRARAGGFDPLPLQGFDR